MIDFNTDYANPSRAHLKKSSSTFCLKTCSNSFILTIGSFWSPFLRPLFKTIHSNFHVLYFFQQWWRLYFYLQLGCFSKLEKKEKRVSNGRRKNLCQLMSFTQRSRSVFRLHTAKNWCKVRISIATLYECHQSTYGGMSTHNICDKYLHICGYVGVFGQCMRIYMYMQQYLYCFYMQHLPSICMYKFISIFPFSNWHRFFSFLQFEGHPCW